MTSWSRGASVGDFARLMLYFYATGLPAALRRPHWSFDLRYAPPIGAVRLALRDNKGADLFIWSEVIEQQAYALPLTAPPATILDLGANIGLTTIYFARLYPGAALACVEPMPGNVTMLRRNLAMNGIDAAIFTAAVHSEDGTVCMQRAEKDHDHSVINGRDTPPNERFEVAAIAVPTMLERLGWERVGLVKMDIEGHETVVLSERCDWLHRVDAMCLEYHFDGGQARLGDIAAHYGFRTPHILREGLWFLER